MDKNILKKYIRNSVNESLKQIVNEQNEIAFKQAITEKITKEVIKRLNENDAENKQNAVMKALNNDMYNHAEIAYKLYPNMDKDTARSYFSKKFRQEPDDDGQIRQFSEDEVNTIYNMIRKR